jgi:alkaline phosphatase D
LASQLALVVVIAVAARQSFAELTHGPIVGHVAPREANVWARGSSPGEYRLHVYADGETSPCAASSALTSAERDLTLVWRVTGLEPGRSYRYAVSSGSESPMPHDDQQFATPHEPANQATVKLAFGSCAWDVSHPRQPVWTAIEAAGADAVVLLGDTPYIDSTDLEVQRARYRDFWSIAELQTLVRRTPVYAVWDDHDFGPDNALGLIPGKENSRRAFLEYHANPSYGLESAGIFTKFRRGPVEVFLLDTRWFANTENSPVNPERKTLLGRAQWDWLRDGLKQSTAPVKVLACGMIWNEAVDPGKIDCWMAYPYEREAVFQFLKQAKIEGVLLIGGDIHRSRHLIHPTRHRVGYDLHEFVASPLAENPAPDNNIPSPYLRYDAELRDSFLMLRVAVEPGGAAIQADFWSRSDVRYTVRLSLDELRTPR